MKKSLFIKLLIILAPALLSAAPYNESAIRITDLADMVLYENYPGIEAELKGGVNINAPTGALGRPTALMLASGRGNLRMVEFLAGRNAAINQKDDDENDALMYAAQSGNVKIIKFLLSKGAHVDNENNRGKTALEIASEKGDDVMVKLLLDKGADRGIGLSLPAASRYGYSSILKMLLKKNALVTLKDRNGATAFFHAAEGGHREAAELLLQNGADVNMARKDSVTPVMASVMNGDTAMTALLLSKGAALELKNSEGRTVFMEAIRTNMPEINRLFVNSNINIHDRDFKLDTALHYLCQVPENPDMKMADTLLKKGAAVNIKNRDGKTPLMYASEKGHLELVKQLLGSGADARAVDKNRKDAMALAALSGHDEVVALFKSTGLPDTGIKPDARATREVLDNPGTVRFFSAVRRGNAAVIIQELEKGFTVNTRDREENTPLIALSRSPLPQKVKVSITAILINAGAGVNHENSKPLGAIDYALEYNDYELVRLLIEKGAGRKGLPLLLSAFTNGDMDTANYIVSNKNINVSEALLTVDDYRIVRLLVEAGGDVNFRDSAGRTPLMRRCELNPGWGFYRNSLAIEEYLKAGADIDVKDSKGISALALSRASGNRKLSEFLVSKGAK